MEGLPLPVDFIWHSFFIWYPFLSAIGSIVEGLAVPDWLAPTWQLQPAEEPVLRQMCRLHEVHIMNHVVPQLVLSGEICRVIRHFPETAY